MAFRSAPDTAGNGNRDVLNPSVNVKEPHRDLASEEVAASGAPANGNGAASELELAERKSGRIVERENGDFGTAEEAERKSDVA